MTIGWTLNRYINKNVTHAVVPSARWSRGRRMVFGVGSFSSFRHFPACERPSAFGDAGCCWLQCQYRCVPLCVHRVASAHMLERSLAGCRRIYSSITVCSTRSAMSFAVNNPQHARMSSPDGRFYESIFLCIRSHHHYPSGVLVYLYDHHTTSLIYCRCFTYEKKSSHKQNQLETDETFFRSVGVGVLVFSRPKTHTPKNDHNQFPNRLFARHNKK